MSDSENTEASVPIVNVESYPSTSTSVDRVSNDDSDTSSVESIGTSAEVLPQTDDGILIVPVARASASPSFDGLTIPIAVHLDPKFPRTSYGRVTATGLTTRELPDPNILHREANDSNSAEELKKTKKRLPGDFILKNNTVEAELPTLALEVDRSRFRMFLMMT